MDYQLEPSTLPHQSAEVPDAPAHPLGLSAAQIAPNIRPSGLESLHPDIGCPGRAAMEAAAKSLTEGRLKNIYAENGISVHEGIHQVLLGEMTVQEGLQKGYYPPDKIPFIQHIDETVGRLDSAYGGCEILLEHSFPERADMTGSGTPDLQMIPRSVLRYSRAETDKFGESRVGILGDWKSGFQAVSADNLQARDYALSMKEAYDLDEVISFILQPDQEPSVTKFVSKDFAEAAAYRDEVKEAALDPNAVVRPNEKCRMCSATTFCSVLYDESVRIVDDATSRGLDSLDPHERGLVAHVTHLSEKASVDARSIAVSVMTEADQEKQLDLAEFSLRNGKASTSVPREHNAKLFAVFDAHADADGESVTAAHRDGLFHAVKSVDSKSLSTAMALGNPHAGERLTDSAAIIRGNPVFEMDKGVEGYGYPARDLMSAARDIQTIDPESAVSMNAHLTSRVDVHKAALSLKETIKEQALEEGQPVYGYHVRSGNKKHQYAGSDLAQAFYAIEGNVEAEQMFWASLTFAPKAVKELAADTGSESLQTKVGELILTKRGDPYAQIKTAKQRAALACS